jgi:hypothetical protein
MGEKKPKQQPKKWTKVVIALVCVFFVLIMVLSGMGTSWISIFSAVKPGDTVTIDFTIRDRNGNPLVTTDQQVYQKAASSGAGIFFSKQLVLQANQSSKTAIIPIQVYSTDGGWSKTFALFGGEFDTISSNLVGMKHDEQKSIRMPFSDSMTQSWSAAQLKSNDVNISDIQIGDNIAMGISDTPELGKNTTTQSYSVRVGEVI